MSLEPWVWLIVPLGVCRAMMIVLHDKIFEWPRGFIERHGGAYLRYLIGCPWCVSTQLALYTVGLLAWESSRSITLWVLAALSASLMAVVADRLVDRFTPDPPAAPVSTPRPETTPEQVRQALGTGRGMRSKAVKRGGRVPPGSPPPSPVVQTTLPSPPPRP